LTCQEGSTEYPMRTKGLSLIQINVALAALT
jgi:hypothetical protein